jgi:glycosyltransferase involved in cell wall biosynthesis
VVPSYRGQDEIFGCLESLARQDLPFDDYEIVVVLNGPEDRSAARIRDVREAWPDLRTRIIRTATASAGRARNLGLASVVGEYVTFVDDDDRVSPQFLRIMLSLARPGIVPLAQLADVQGSSEPSYDNYIGEQYLPLAGEIVPVTGNVRALGFNACKLIPTTVAQSVMFDESLRSGEDIVYWFDVARQLRFRFAVSDVGATYFRAHRTGTVSRQDPGYDFLVSQRLDVIERLAQREIAASSTESAGLRVALINGQSAQIAAFLREHPNEREAAIAEIDRRRLGNDVNWRELNRGLARELAICYAFMPFADTSALVAARRIRQRREYVDVISSTLEGGRRSDRSGWRIAAPFVARHHQVRDPATMAFEWTALSWFCQDGLAKVDEWVQQQGTYSSVYSRAMLPGSHLLAALVKLRYPETTWRAEFSDPIAWNPYGERRIGPAEDDELWRTFTKAMSEAGVTPPAEPDVPMAVELIAYALADEIVFTNQNQMEFMLGYLDDEEVADRVRTRSRWEHHPTPPPDLYLECPARYDVPSDRVNVAYFGAFYATRGITEVVEALRALDAASRERVAFHVFTPDPSTLEREVDEHGLADVMVVNGHVPYLQCLNIAARMDVLLVNDARTRQHYPINPYLPSKWSDYQGSGADVWAVVEEGSVLDGMEVRYKSRLGDAAGARKVLESIIRDGPSTRSGGTQQVRPEGAVLHLAEAGLP